MREIDSLDGDRGVITCPQDVEMPLDPSGVGHFPTKMCPLRFPCINSVLGRSVTIHPDEQFLEELRVRQLTPAGGSVLRERVQLVFCHDSSALTGRQS